MDRRGVEVRMGNSDCLNPTELVDMADGLVVDVADAVPENVTTGSTAEKCSLSNCYRWDSDDAHEPGLLIFMEDVLIFS